MLRKPQSQFNGQSQTFKTFRKVRSTNTFKSQVFSKVQNIEIQNSSRTPNKTYQHDLIFTTETEQNTTPRVRLTDTYRHTDIFSPMRLDNEKENTSARQRSVDNSQHQSNKQNNPLHHRDISNPQKIVNVSEFLQEKEKKRVQQTTEYREIPQGNSYRKLNILDASPCQWQDSVQHPGLPGKCNEQAEFSYDYSRRKKLHDQQGSYDRHRNTSLHEQKSQRSERKHSSTSEHLDGRLIFPTTLHFNQIDSIVHRHARLKQNDMSSRSLNQQDSISAFKKMMKGKQSSMDQHYFYTGAASQKPVSLSKTYISTSQNKILAFLNGSLSDVTRRNLGFGNIQEGAKSNILYGVTEKSPQQPAKEPDVLNFQVSQTDGKFSTNQLKTFCKQKGYGLVKVEEHVNNVSHEPIGTASFTLRVKQFLNNDSNAVEGFFKQKGMECAQENSRQHNYKALIQQGDNNTPQSKMDQSSISQTFYDDYTNQTLDISQKIIQKEPKGHGKRLSHLSKKENNTNQSFERQLRSTDRSPFSNNKFKR